MLALKVLDVKNCMNDLLASEAFDRFLLSDATITTRMTYSLDGHLTKGYLTEEELLEEGLSGERCVPYGYVRKLCFDMIKGKRKPASFHFTFLCPQKLLREIIEGQSLSIQPSEVANLTLNLRYVGSKHGRSMENMGISLFWETFDRSGKSRVRKTEMPLLFGACVLL